MGGVSLYIGVDGGGTRATGVLLDGSGAELARASGPAGIVRDADGAASAAVVAELARRLLSAAGAASATALCCGLAGAGRVAEQAAVRDAVRRHGVAAHVVVVGDAEAAMDDAFGGGAGVLLIAGTGSIAWAAGSGRRPVRTGGWGHLLGDEGSGYAIGLAGLRAILRAADGRAGPTALRDVLLAATGLRAPEDLVRFAAAAAKADVAALAPHVLDCAARGDAAASAILGGAVHELADLAVTAARGAGLAGPAVAFAGGVLGAAAVRERVAREITRRLPGAKVVDRDVDAARGAALIARRMHP